MYVEIETEFKNKSWSRSELSFRIGLLIFYLASVYISYERFGIGNRFWYRFAVIVIVAILAIQTYVFCMLKKNQKHKPFWKFTTNLDIYKKEIVESDVKSLIEIIKKFGINTRPKVQELIRHYQTLIPRSIIGTGTILSIIAISISILSLSLSEGNTLSNERLSMLVALSIVIGILYFMIKSINEQLSSFRRPRIYLYIEQLLAIIYFRSLVK